MDYHIYHMFPKLLNLYGDHGNIITLSFFAKKLGLNPIVHEIDDVNDIDWDQVDFMLIGGGSDREQAMVTEQLFKIKTDLKKKVEEGLPLLAVCGGYQFLGEYYEMADGTRLEGLHLIDMYTIAERRTRLVGNTLLESAEFREVIGFVNHSGQTFHELQPFGTTTVGYGNSANNDDEGVRYKNVIGTYLHGPLLPKNPSVTLFFLELFMKEHNISYDLSALDLTLENAARDTQISRILK